MPTEQVRADSARAYLRRLAFSAPVWCIFATISFGQTYVSIRTRGEMRGPFPWDLVAANYVYWWLATPLIMSLVLRFPFDIGRWKSALTVHLAAALTLALFPELIRVGIMFLIQQAPREPGLLWVYRVQLGSRYGFEVTTYVAIAAVIAALELSRRSRDREMHASRLETELAQSRLQVLTAQLHPHFLFNALNSIAMLIRDGAYDDARRVVVAYGELLRDILRTTDREIPLRDEIAFTNRYLAIEQTRFPDTFSSSIDLAAGLEDALVPSFVLQPIIENALHHAFSGADAAHLSVSASGQNGILRLQVTDNGCGLPASDTAAQRPTGLGLRNTRMRLAAYYGDAQRFELSSEPGRGTRVVLELPLRTSGAVLALKQQTARSLACGA